MVGCKKQKVNSEWMKAMLNWDLFTHPCAEDFASNSSDEEKLSLSKEWKDYMDEKDMFISFYEWRTKGKILNLRNCSKKALEPCSIKPICCSV
jgi:hypothetical protein